MAQESSRVPSIAVVDYGMGNLRSVQKALELVGCEALITSDSSVIESADGLLLPGVGAFRDCMANLTQSRLVDPILEYINGGKPFLGLCLGMQILLTVSEEFGLHQGLDALPGRVVRFPRKKGLKVPHMGWNRVYFSGENPLVDGIPDGSFFYFVHSFYADPEDPGIIAGWTRYNVRFCSAIRWKNIFACQFHPEKSQRFGMKLLENFGRIAAEWEVV